MNNSAASLRGQRRLSRHLAPLLLLGALGLGGLGVVLASQGTASGQGSSAPTVEVARAKSKPGSPAPREVRYRLGTLRCTSLGQIGQELELSHKFLPGLEVPRVVIQAGPEITCGELGKLLDEILLRGFSRVEIQRLSL